MMKVNAKTGKTMEVFIKNMKTEIISFLLLKYKVDKKFLAFQEEMAAVL